MIILRNKYFTNFTPALKRIKLKGPNPTEKYLEGIIKSGNDVNRRNVGAAESKYLLKRETLNAPKNPTIGKVERLIKKGTENFARRHPTAAKYQLGL